MPSTKPAKKRRKSATSQISVGRITKALRLLDRHEKCGTNPEAKTAMKFYTMAKKFFALNGRFRKAYTRKKKK